MKVQCVCLFMSHLVSKAHLSIVSNLMMLLIAAVVVVLALVVLVGRFLLQSETIKSLVQAANDLAEEYNDQYDLDATNGNDAKKET